MSRITTVFERLRSRGERALIPYLTAGYPHPNRTVELMSALVCGGADIIELGVPFSDPIADGPTIQASCAASLKAGTTLRGILDLVRQFRQQHDTPVVLFGAYNPFLRYGIEALTRDAAEAGADGLLIPDLPADEGAEMEPAVKAAGLDLIYLLAPTSTPERIQEIASRSTGFIYYISVKGVTGARQAFTAELKEPISRIRAATKLPVAVGFGISTPEHAATVAAHADGVIVGSALISLIGQHATASDLTCRVTDFIKSLKAPLRPA